jgi:ribonuclease P protein component
VLFAAPGGSEATRVGISVSKRVGGAVVRNRLKRRIREIVNARYEKIESGWDIVVLVRPVAAAAGFHEIEAAVISLLSRAKLMSTESECAPSSGD